MKNFENQPGWSSCVTSSQHCAGLPPHVGNTRTSTTAQSQITAYGEFYTSDHWQFSEREVSARSLYGTDRFTAERDANSAKLARTGRTFKHR